MTKTQAIALLGDGDVAKAAALIGTTYGGVWNWPDDLPQRISDRVLGCAWRAGKLPRPSAKMAPALKALL